jgi:tetrahydromethanopterin S-methyltransferase subunit G
VAQRPAESVTGAEAVHNVNWNGRDFNPLRARLGEDTTGSEFHDGDLATEFEQSIGRQVGTADVDRDFDLTDVSDGDGGER